MATLTLVKDRSLMTPGIDVYQKYTHASCGEELEWVEKHEKFFCSQCLLKGFPVLVGES